MTQYAPLPAGMDYRQAIQLLRADSAEALAEPLGQAGH